MRVLSDLYGTLQSFFRLGTVAVRDTGGIVAARTKTDGAYVPLAASQMNLMGSTSGTSGFIAPAVAAQQWTLPSSDGGPGQVLATTGTGVLEFTSASAETTTFTAVNGDSQTLVCGQAVVVNADASVQRALASALGTSRTAGLVLTTSITVAASGQVQTDGIITLTANQWAAVVTGHPSGLTPGAPYYLDPSVAGNITTTIPSAPGQFVTFVGLALSTTSMDLDFQQPIWL